MKRIVITGASGAIGTALAQAYAQSGVVLYLQGRQRPRLEALAQACRANGANVEITELDLRDMDSVRRWGAALTQHASIDLLIVNAGMNIHVDPLTRCENPEASADLLTTNLLSAVALVQSVVPAMQQRKQGQIALISSLAAWRGLPTTPSYSASKAGLKAYGESLRIALAPDGIQVSVILPGYVQSAMCDGMPGPKPFVWTPERAAKAIRHGLSANRGRIRFPFWLSLGSQALACLPDRLAGWMLNRLGYGVDR